MQVADCVDCRVVVAPVSGSVFVLDCTRCVLSIAAKQIRLRNVTDCELRVFVPNPEGLIFEASTRVTVGPWEVSYEELASQYVMAGMDHEKENHWRRVYDFSPDPEGGRHWSFVDEREGEKRVALSWSAEGLCGGRVKEAVEGGGGEARGERGSEERKGNRGDWDTEVKVGGVKIGEKGGDWEDVDKMAGKEDAKKVAEAGEEKGERSDLEEEYLEDYDEDDFETNDSPPPAPRGGSSATGIRSASPLAADAEASVLSGAAWLRNLDDYDEVEELEEESEGADLKKFDAGGQRRRVCGWQLATMAHPVLSVANSVPPAVMCSPLTRTSPPLPSMEDQNCSSCSPLDTFSRITTILMCWMSLTFCSHTDSCMLFTTNTLLHFNYFRYLAPSALVDVSHISPAFVYCVTTVPSATSPSALAFLSSWDTPVCHLPADARIENSEENQQEPGSSLLSPPLP